MPVEYGMETLVSCSPVLGSSFLGGGSPYFNDCSRYLWSHASSLPFIELGSSVTTVQAKKTAKMVSDFVVPTSSSVFKPSSTTTLNCSSSSPSFSSTLPCAFSSSSSLLSPYPSTFISPTPSSLPNNSILVKVNSPSISSIKSSSKYKKKYSVETPLLLNLKSCLISRSDEQQEELIDSANPYSPTKCKKKVSFADTNGGDLARIRIIKERSDCPPKWSSEFLSQLTGGAKAEAVAVCNWTLTFSQPVSNYLKWRKKLEERNIALENVEVKEPQSVLIGSLKVRNLSYEKRVTVRYTIDNWFSYSEIDASFIPPAGSLSSSSSVSYNLYDTFSFKVPLPDSSKADKLEFCLRYRTTDVEFWDNNGERNYAVVSFHAKKEKVEKQKYDDIYKAHMDSWSEFSAWQQFDDGDAPYW